MGSGEFTHTEKGGFGKKSGLFDLQFSNMERKIILRPVSLSDSRPEQSLLDYDRFIGAWLANK